MCKEGTICGKCGGALVCDKCDPPKVTIEPANHDRLYELIERSIDPATGKIDLDKLLEAM